MAEESRTTKSIRNMLLAFSEQLVYSVMTFACRTVFIYTLGKNYLGFNGIFTDILTFLSLAELGVGTSIIYSMYQPAARHDYRMVAALLNLYKKIYHIIGTVVFIIGLCLTPFLEFFISDMPDIPELPVIYLLYLLNTTISYFFIYKKSILITDQKNYIASIIYVITVFIQNLLQIIFLLFTHNYIIYLIIHVCCTIGNNTAVSLYVDRHYSYLRQYRNEKIDSESKRKIYTNVKAMFVSKISSAVVSSTDSLLISKFVSTIILGMYSNYTLFVTMLRSVVGKFFEALTGSVGNMIAIESHDKTYDTFRKIWFVNYWIISFSCAVLFSLVNLFIELWAGEEYLLEQKVVFVICLNLYMRLIRNTFLTFLDTYGLFVELKIKSIAEAGINLAVSLIFVLFLDMGIYGVLLGTFVSNITTNFWYEPYLLFKKKFKINMYVYFKLFLKYFLVMSVSSAVFYYICNCIFTVNNWATFIVKGLICCIGINLFYICVYFRTKEFRYFVSLIMKKCKRKYKENL